MFRYVVFFVMIVLSSSFVRVQAQEDAFEIVPCPMPYPADVLTEGEDIVCGYVTVPVRHAQPEGQTIRLLVIRITSSADAPSSPVFLLQGGPGASADFFPFVVAYTAYGPSILPDRDIIIVEQRGTLLSEPDLSCYEDVEYNLSVLDQMLSAEEELSGMLDAVQLCYERLNAEFDLSAFNSVENAADINAVRVALGYDKINLHGISYGSLLSQHYLRDFPQTLDTVILDAVAPISLDWISGIGRSGQRAFGLLFDACVNDPVCNATYPDLEETFYNLILQMNESPPIFSLEDDGVTYSTTLTGRRLTSSLFSMMYSERSLPYVPLLIYQAASGDFSEVGQFAIGNAFGGGVELGMSLSVVCSESATYEASMNDGLNPLLSDAFMFYSVMLESCEFWDVTPLSGEIYQPVASDVPVLLLSGQFDPITPPAYAEIVGETLPNSIELVLPGGGHGVLATDCGASIIADFLRSPLNPNTSCIENMSFQFFIPNGSN